MGCLEANMFMLYESMKAFILLVYICAITFQCVFYNSSPQYDNSFTHRYFNPLFQFHLLFCPIRKNMDFIHWDTKGEVYQNVIFNISSYNW